MTQRKVRKMAAGPLRGGLWNRAGRGRGQEEKRELIVM